MKMHLDPQSVWARCLDVIRDSISTQSFHTWFQPTSAVALNNKLLTVSVPSQFFYEWLEHHYSELIHRVLTQVLGEGARLTFSIAMTQKEDILTIPSSNRKQPRNGSNEESHLSDRYTFDNFVEGASNQFAKAAALAVAEAPGRTTFNPLVIYGGVGLGKTHLIQAIGNMSRTLGYAPRVLYVSSEKFTIEFINSIQNNRTTEFSAIYRNVDLLLVDDIQFFENKERTQEEFFHTFNTLHQKGKQIVLSCDRPPKELAGVEDRLISRFQWGLVADIQPPDLETRIAILQKKAEENSIELPSDVIQFIASNVTSNIRELEGSLIRLLAFSSLNGRDIDLSLAQSVLKDLSLTKPRYITIEGIQRIVANEFNIPEDMLRAKTRKKEIALARQISMYLAKNLTNHSLKTIGLHFGGRDHTTVIHAIRTIEKLQKKDSSLRDRLETLKRKINTAGY
jgi:chromosomal replication initiator protein